MRTYPIRDDAGVVFAFEIPALLFGRRFAKELSDIGGVSNVRPRRRWVGDRDVLIRFSYLGKEFVVWEPFGDNSRWWIGPEQAEPPHSSVAELERSVAQLSARLTLRPFERTAQVVKVLPIIGGVGIVAVFAMSIAFPAIREQRWFLVSVMIPAALIFAHPLYAAFHLGRFVWRRIR